MTLRGIEPFREWVNRERPDDHLWRRVVEVLLDLSTADPLLWSHPHPDFVPDGQRPDDRLIDIPGTTVRIRYEHVHTDDWPGPIDVVEVTGR